jgi:hypothetical protein
MPGKAKGKQNKPKGPLNGRSSLTGKGRLNGVGNLKVSQAGAFAAISSKPMRIGMGDVLRHPLSWLIGYIYVGNGTTGTTDNVYLIDPTKTDIIIPEVSGTTSGGANIPVLSFDGLVGATYASDIFKHYGRVRYGKSKLCVVSLNPSTTNQMTVAIAPKRGASSIGTFTNLGSAATALPQTDVWSMTGAKNIASWESQEIDLTPFIAGGSGALQNEFDTVVGAGAADVAGNSDYVARQVVPCTFAVSGNNSTTALRGTVTHAVIGEQMVDLLDFIGGNTPQGVDSVLVKRRSIVCFRPARLSLDEKGESGSAYAKPPLRRVNGEFPLGVVYGVTAPLSASITSLPPARDSEALEKSHSKRSQSQPPARIDIGQDYYFVRKTDDSTAAAPTKTAVPEKTAVPLK